MYRNILEVCDAVMENTVSLILQYRKHDQRASVSNRPELTKSLANIRNCRKFLHVLNQMFFAIQSVVSRNVVTSVISTLFSCFPCEKFPSLPSSQ